MPRSADPNAVLSANRCCRSMTLFSYKRCMFYPCTTRGSGGVAIFVRRDTSGCLANDHKELVKGRVMRSHFACLDQHRDELGNG
eukprot:11619432-Karenia_brevis.AAC.1